MAVNISKRLAQEIKGFPEAGVAILETSAENSVEAGTAVVKLLTQKGRVAVVLSASRPHSNLMQMYSKKGVGENEVFIVCCVCGHGSQKDADNVLHMQSAESLTEISVALNEVTKKFKGKSFLFIDSISTMLIHNDPKTLAKFIHGLLVRMRLNNVSAFLINIAENTDKETRAELVQLCDKVIKL